jgi:pimeloyl-ACP methyl ester carboxylesterase
MNRMTRVGRSINRVTRKMLGAFAALLAAALILTACVPGAGNSPKTSTPSAHTVDGFQTQKANWEKCRNGKAECAKVSAPLDWDDVDGDETIELAMTKLPSKSDDPQGTLFVNPGGPGASGTDYVANSAKSFAKLREHYDIVGWDPRGVGQSSQVVCLDAGDMDDYLFNVEDYGKPGSKEWFKKTQDENKSFGKACQENTGDLLKHVDTISTVHDLDMLRGVVGDKKLNYLGFSYGTYIGARYADEFGSHVGHMVLDGAMDPGASNADVVEAQTGGFEKALRAYLESCIGTPKCPFQGSVEDAEHDVHKLLERTEKHPLTGSDGRKVGQSTMLTAIITPLYSKQSWSALHQLFSEAKKGDGDTALALADFYYDRDENGEYENNSTEAFTAINCLDYPVKSPPDYAGMRKDAEELGKKYPVIGKFQGYSDIGCLGWPAQGVDTRGDVSGEGADPIVVIGTTGDPATPYAWAESLAKQLESGTLITYKGEGHTAYGGSSSCVNSAVNDYFIDNKMPKKDLTCS